MRKSVNEVFKKVFKNANFSSINLAPKKIRCIQCSKSQREIHFDNIEQLRKHIKTDHDEGKIVQPTVHESKNDLNYDESCKCILCSKIFDDKIALKRHTSNFHEGRYKCDICNYCFKNPVLLNVHVLKNHKRIKNEPS